MSFSWYAVRTPYVLLGHSSFPAILLCLYFPFAISLIAGCALHPIRFPRFGSFSSSSCNDFLRFDTFGQSFLLPFCFLLLSVETRLDYAKPDHASISRLLETVLDSCRPILVVWCKSRMVVLRFNVRQNLVKT